MGGQTGPERILATPLTSCIMGLIPHYFTDGGENVSLIDQMLSERWPLFSRARPTSDPSELAHSAVSCSGTGQVPQTQHRVLSPGNEDEPSLSLPLLPSLLLEGQGGFLTSWGSWELAGESLVTAPAPAG